MIRLGPAILAAAVATGPAAASETLRPDPCDGPGVRVEILGSGGADLARGRAASAYLLRVDGSARILVDAGAGSAPRFTESGARSRDLNAILFTRLRVDHTLDFPALIALALREGRTRKLPLYGPMGNRFAPSTVTFVRALLDGTRGAYRQLSGVLSPLAKGGFKLDPHDVRPRRVGVRRREQKIVDVRLGGGFDATATYIDEDGPPILAWQVQTQGRRVVITSAVTGNSDRLVRLARDADLLIANHAPAHGTAPAGQGEPIATAGAIGRIAAQSQVKRLVLSQRSAAVLGTEDAALADIRKDYAGPVAFADDLDCFALP